MKVGRLPHSKDAVSPVAKFLVFAFAWTWIFWCAAIPLRPQPFLVMPLVMIGGFGPALAAVETLRARSGLGLDLSAKRLTALLMAAAVIFAVLSLSHIVGSVPGTRELAPELALSFPHVLATVVVCLVGGWVISAAVSNCRQVRDRMVSLLPWRLPLRWSFFALFFYPGMIIASWGMASLLKVPVEYPMLWGKYPLYVLPLYALTFAVTILVQGGNEEPGWRGFLQPELQRRFSPLVAAILVSFAWSLWHLPLFFNGVYEESALIAGMTGGAVYRLFLAIFLAWFYICSGGNIFLTCWMHTTFNLMPIFLPIYVPGLVILWILVTAGIVVKDKMWRHTPIEPVVIQC